MLGQAGLSAKCSGKEGENDLGGSMSDSPCCQELRFNLGESLDIGRSQGSSQQINRRNPARPFPVLPHHRLGLLPPGNPSLNTARSLAA